MTAQPSDEETMALCAIRYTIGRMSYIVGDGVRWARKYGKESEWMRDVLIRDLQVAVDREDNKGMRSLGMEMDSREWRAVLAELLEIPTRNINPDLVNDDVH